MKARGQRNAMLIMWWHCLGLSLALLSVAHGKSLIRVEVDDHRTVVFHNASLGLWPQANGRQCDATGHPRGQKLDHHRSQYMFTPNRRLQKDTLADAIHHDIRLAHVLAVGARPMDHQGPMGSINLIMSAWDSWMDNFYSVVANSTSLILLFDSLDYVRIGKEKHLDHRQYLDSVLVNNMGAKPVACVDFTDSLEGACQQRNNTLALDQDYLVYSISFDTSVAPLILFVGIFTFPPPAWTSLEKEPTLFAHWQPPKLRTIHVGYEYTKMTNWYSYNILTLRILDFFDYAAKIDDDLYFVKRFPKPNLPLLLAESGAYMLTTQKNWLTDNADISGGVANCMNAFLSSEVGYCSNLLTNASGEVHTTPMELVPGGIEYHELWHEPRLVVPGYFVVFWLGLFNSPENMHFGKFWNEYHPGGMWDYRWGDQQWWPRPLLLFGSGNVDHDVYRLVEIDPNKRDEIIHKLPGHDRVKNYNFFTFQGTTKAQRQEYLKNVGGNPFQ